jgi:HPt (histidine-containing phosphotransfer) domain-containing protein
MNLSELARSLDLDVEVVRKLAATFLSATEQDLLELQKALAAQDAAAVSRVAHHIKGAAAALELEDIRAEAERLERQARAGRLDDGEAGLAALREHLAALTDEPGQLGS